MPKVLVIDDAPVTRNSFVRVLRKEGFDATAVGDGLQALGTVGTQPPDLIILDLNMPHMNGLEVLTRLRQNPLWRGVPILVFSGTANPANLEKAKALGASEVMQKGSVTVPQVMERIKALTATAAPF